MIWSGTVTTNAKHTISANAEHKWTYCWSLPVAQRILSGFTTHSVLEFASVLAQLISSYTSLWYNHNFPHLPSAWATVACIWPKQWCFHSRESSLLIWSSISQCIKCWLLVLFCDLIAYPFPDIHILKWQRVGRVCCKEESGFQRQKIVRKRNEPRQLMGSG